ncbi:MAG TPA: extracellular solute-binding protein, partial [Chthonomonadales bacterium]|nr:extracellular solute-binding protein [Chthonomonadales bacterium]
MWSGQEELNFERVLRKYEELHPGIHFRNLGAVSDDTKTIRALVAGVPPDLFTLSDASYLGPLADNHALMQLDTRFKSSGLRESDFVPASLGMCRYRGRLFGMPFLIDDDALLWNKHEFAQAGMNPARPPRTLQQLADDAARLTIRAPSGDIKQLGLRPPDLNLIMKLMGGNVLNPSTGEVEANSPANIRALTWYKRLIDREGGIARVSAFQSGFASSQGPGNPFFVGKIAMVIDGEWNPYWISRYAPRLEYGVTAAPPPEGHPERSGTTWFGGNVFCIPVAGKHPDEAWKFLVWAQSQQAQVMFAHDMNNVPNQREALYD